MGITLNIVAEELREAGVAVSVRAKGSRALEDVQIFSEASGKGDAQVAYLIDGSGIFSVPADFAGVLIFAGSDAGFPPRADAFVALDGGVMAALSLLQGIWLKYRRWERAMDSSLLKGEGLQKLIDLSMPFVRNHIDIVDPAMKLLAHSNDDLDDPITNNLNRLGYHTESAIREFRLDRRFRLWAEQDGLIVNTERKISRFSSVVFTFKSGESFSVIVVMICNEMEPNDYICDVLRLFIARVQHYVKAEYSQNKPIGNALDTFLRDLLHRRAGDSTAIAERCKFVGLSYEGPYCLFYFGLENSLDIPKLGYVASIAQRSIPAVTMVYGDAVLVLCSNCRHLACRCNCRAEMCPKGHSTIVSRFDKLLSSYRRSCACSAQIRNLEQLPLAYAQAKATYEAQAERRLDSRGERVAYFDDWCLPLMAAADTAEGAAFCASSEYLMLDDIAAYDEANATDFYGFLRSYLENERRASLVAELQNMHRNNVAKRVERLTQLFGVNADDPRERLNLLVAYRIRDGLPEKRAQS